MTMNATLSERLERNSMPEPNSGCRLWLGTCLPRGYGKIGWKGEVLYAHRAAWAEANGPIPSGLKVLHKCDVPSCINPDHLFLGTDADNMLDKARKLRTTTTLNLKTVQSIFRDPRKASDVAATHGISVHRVHSIRSGRRFAWLIPA